MEGDPPESCACRAGLPVKRLTDSDPLSRPMCETEGGGISSRKRAKSSS